VRPRDLAAALLSREDVVSVEVEGSKLLVARTVKPDLFYAELPAMAGRLGIPITEIQSPDDNLSAVFDYLVSA
jgi:ABC-2 type transport system ATP-binding protein